MGACSSLLFILRVRLLPLELSEQTNLKGLAKESVSTEY